MGERLIVSKDPFIDAARELAHAIAAADADHGCARLAISGGSAMEALRPLPALLAPGLWARLRLTWIDERCVETADPQSNRGTAYAKGLLSTDRPVSRELPLWLDGDTPERAQSRFLRRFDEEFGEGLDVTLLGLGEDGHIASLFPGHPARFATTPITFVADSPKPPPRRMTLTYKALRTSLTNVLVASGEGKRAALEQILSGDTLAPANALPGELVIVTDLEDLRRPPAGAQR